VPEAIVELARQEEHAQKPDTVLQLTGTVFRIMDYQSRVLQANQAQTWSPRVATALLEFCIRWSRTYLMPLHTSLPYVLIYSLTVDAM